MALQNELTAALKEAMKAKDSLKLESLRAIKSAILLRQTSGAGSDSLSEALEIKLLQKLVKQRKDSATIFGEQNREDLAVPEEAQAAIIKEFLPAQLSKAEVEAAVLSIISQLGASGMQDMGKVIGKASQKLAGKADGKTKSNIFKQNKSL